MNTGIYGYTARSAHGSGWMVVTVLLVLLALAAGVLVYALFLVPRQTRPLKGFAKWLHSFLNFEEMVTPIVIKIAYVFAAVLITLSGLLQILTGSNAVGGLLALTLGNVGVRIAFELIVLLFSIHDSIRSIDRKTKDENPRPVPPRPEFLNQSRPYQAPRPQPQATPEPPVQPETPSAPQAPAAPQPQAPEEPSEHETL